VTRQPCGTADHLAALAPGGTLVLVEPLTAGDDLAANLASPTAAMNCAASTFLCVPASLSQPVGLGLGRDAPTVIITNDEHIKTRALVQQYARFLDTPGTITSDNDIITVTLSRRAYSPVLRQADLSTDTPIPWWQNRPLRFRFA
jgi:hypothetical protein